jgi:hypothetical protein
MIEIMRLTPSVVASSFIIMNNVANITVTAPVAPTPGNLLIIQMAGIQSRLPNDLSGWQKVNISPASGTSYYFIRVAAVGEPSSWNLSAVSNLQGGCIYYELGNVGLNSVPSYVEGAATYTTGGVSVSTIPSPTYNIIRPQIVLTSVVLSSSSTGWFADNGFVHTTTDLALFTKGAYKRYFTNLSSDVVNWSTGGGTRSGHCSRIVINGKPLY